MTRMTDTSSLSQPLHGASFAEAVSRFFAKYATFSGRASRSEYWWVALGLVILNSILGVAFLMVSGPTATQLPTEVQYSPATIAVLVIWVVIALALLIPGIALTVRRLHDGNFSGWLYLLHLIPSVGSLIVFILTLLDSKPEGARFDK